MNATAAAPPGTAPRPRARGKFLFVGATKLQVRGVSYGTFEPSPENGDYPAPEVVARDFAAMAANGINTVRVYSAPPRWLLDTAQAHGLRVVVGLAWEQHVAFLDARGGARSIERAVAAGVRACAGHPAVLCFSIGNEIPAPIVRWHGRRAVERFLARLYRAAKREDPGALVTYVNYPSTEYLDLPFLDLVCFNVFLEDRERLDAYLAKLHTVAGDRPLLVTELGLDSRSHGEPEQARSLDRQLRTALAGGCAGAVVFSWTDDWHRGGYPVEDWSFGLTDRARRPKPALAAVRDAFAAGPPSPGRGRPPVSVVVCTYNGSRTLGACLAAVGRLTYPNFETIVVDDGSADDCADIAKSARVRLIRTTNRGLSAARNSGLEAARGDVVAYIDDDCEPDPDWLTYLVGTLMNGDYAAAGGPNVPPAEDGFAADAVARSPGGPVHVLLTDREAEHVPGCNVAFWKDRLLEIGGFDPQFRVAGDDVDVCWRLRERGWRIGFSPAAQVLHHRRNSVRAFYRQQRGYGRAEALLEQKWPGKYNRGGHVTWFGRVYGAGAIRGRRRIYYGHWGSAPFQSVYERPPKFLGVLPVMPEWYLGTALLAALAVGLSFGLWPGSPLAAAACVASCLVAVAAIVARVTVSAVREVRRPPRPSTPHTLLPLVAFLHLVQPLARLSGRVRAGLTPWRRRGTHAIALPRPATRTLWREEWEPPGSILERIEAHVRAQAAVVRRGGAFDRWDLHVRVGGLGRARLRGTVEEHGGGRQLFRFRISPSWSRGAVVAVPALAALTALAASYGQAALSFVLAAVTLAVLGRALADSGSAVGALADAVRAQEAAAVRTPTAPLRARSGGSREALVRAPEAS